VEVLQIVRNEDVMNYREFGDNVSRTYFIVQNTEEKKQQIWVSENGRQLTVLIDNIFNDIWQIVDIKNVPYDFIAIYGKLEKSLKFYNIKNTRQCLYPEELEQFKTIHI
jgi:hypothetical protein